MDKKILHGLERISIKMLSKCHHENNHNSFLELYNVLV